MEFKEFSKLVQERINRLNEHDLFVVDCSKDEVYDLYQDSFPEGINEIYLERREHDCNTCKGFIRRMGNVVAIIDGKVETIWDVDALAEYKVVTEALDKFIKSRKIVGVLSVDSKKVGAEKTIQQLGSGDVKTWNHFSCQLPSKYVDVSGEKRNLAVTTTELLERAISEITLESIDIVIDLIEQGSLYRGEEQINNIKEFRRIIKEGKETSDLNVFLWKNHNNLISRYKNTVVGTLLEDISNGVDLETTVKSYEKKVAPENYKRPTTLITKGMIKNAMKTIKEIGIEDSLKRRHAKIEDVSINDVLFADRSVSSVMKDTLDELEELLSSEIKPSKKDFSNVTEIGIKDFIENVVPKVDSIEVMLENRHKGNLVNIIAPEVQGVPNIFKWDNPYSWVYNGGVADSIKEKVKQAGGEIDAFMRASLSWYNTDDLDIHVIEPNGTHIYYGNNRSQITGANLDVDMNAGSQTVRDAVENVTWPDHSRLDKGRYKVYVNNFTKRESVDVGFTVQLEIDGEITNLVSSVSPIENIYIDVCDIVVRNDGSIDIEVKNGIETDSRPKDIWGIRTKEFVKVKTMMFSPNHWGDASVGNKHYMFILEGCNNPDPVRGFFNEQLDSKFDKHRKVFEILAQKTKVHPTDNQLAGVGFSSTKREEVLVKVSGSFNRTLLVKF